MSYNSQLLPCQEKTNPFILLNQEKTGRRTHTTENPKSNAALSSLRESILKLDSLVSGLSHTTQLGLLQLEVPLRCQGQEAERKRRGQAPLAVCRIQSSSLLFNIMDSIILISHENRTLLKECLKTTGLDSKVWKDFQIAYI